MFGVNLDRKHLENFDFVLFLTMLLITVGGVVAIYSAGYDPVTASVKKYYVRQIYWLVLGYIMFFTFSTLGHKKLVKYAYIIYFLGLLVLLAVLLSGHIGMGARRWIAIGGFRIQPSEVFKFIWVIFLARLYIEMGREKHGLIGILRKFLWVAPPFALVFLQPDLGTAGTFIVIWGMLLLVIGIKRMTLMLIIASMVLAAPVLWSQMKPYQKKRVITFMNPEKDPFGSGYHVIQSKIAIGSGGLTGKGFLKGTQSHLKFIPERHTDFIFSVIAEEFGLVGSLTIIVLFIILLLRIMLISMNAKEPAGKLICLGVSGFIFFQFYVNVAMTAGMMPVVGIPMPLVSYGGSSLLTFMSMLGLVNGVSMRRFDDPGDD
jgi:rod shape determining protein RodA